MVASNQTMTPSGPSGEATTKQVSCWAIVPAIVTWLLLPVTFLLPVVDSTRAPYFELTNTFSQFALWLSHSGGRFGAPIVAVVMLVLLVARSGISLRRRWKETVFVALVALFFGAGGTAFSVYVIKQQLKVPRPNIISLSGDTGSGALGMTAKAFYESGNKADRREPLAKALTDGSVPVQLSPSIAAHWIEETGYSFPSGHSFSAMFLATFFLTVGATYLATKRLWMFYSLLPWALAVCYSRSILRVHTPTDITVGGLLGLAVGLLAWAVARSLNRRFA